MTKIGVFGAGLIGCYVGGRLALAGAEVVLLARERIRADIAANGLSLSDFTGWRGHVSADEMTVSMDPDSLSDAEIVLVCVKSADTEEAGCKLAQIARPDALIVSLQNGVSNAQRLSEQAPDLSVFAGMVPFNVARLEDGAFHQGTVGGLYFEDDARLHAALTQLMDKAGLEATFSADMDAVMWGKLLMNLNNAINALSGQPLKAQLSQRAYRQCVAMCMREAMDLLQQEGRVTPAKASPIPPGLMPMFLSLPDFLFKIVAQRMLAIDPHARSSMADDLAAGRAPEVDWINGEVVALAARLGADAPINTRVVELVKAAFAAEVFEPWGGERLLAELRGLGIR